MLFPVFMAMLLLSLETGMTMVRQLVLEHGVDKAVRSVRLAPLPTPDPTRFKQSICDNAKFISDCMSNVKVEMIRIDPRNFVGLDAQPDCVDRDDPGADSRNFITGAQNDLLFLRVCTLFDPFLPGTGLGLRMDKQSGGAYALVAQAAFVIEPQE